MSSNNTKIFLTPVMVAAAAALLIFFVVRPQLARVSQFRADIAAVNDQIVAVDARIAGLQTARVELLKVQKQRQQMTVLFPQREDMAAPVAALEAAALAAGIESELTITDELEFPPSKNSGEKPRPRLVSGLDAAQEVPFELQLTSDYRGLLNFFRYLENSAVLVRFGGLAVTAESVQGQQETQPHNTGRAASKLDGVFFMSKSP